MTLTRTQRIARAGLASLSDSDVQFMRDVLHDARTHTDGGTRMPYIEWTPEMGEISGFGGSYEAGCRAMVKAGVEYWEERDAAHARGEGDKFDPHYRGYEGVFGLIDTNNGDAEKLDQVMMDATIPSSDGGTQRVGDGATGAMHQAAVNHILAFRRLGAEEYRRTLVERERKEIGVVCALPDDENDTAPA